MSSRSHDRTARWGVSVASGLLLCLASAIPSHGATIGWWRMGDSDGSLAAPPVADGQLVGSEGTLSAVGDNDIVRLGHDAPSGGLEYSTDVPGSFIYDPLTASYRTNTWSIEADSASRERTLTNGAFVVPTAFTFETFVKFDTSAASVDFALQSRSISGGWRLGTQADGSLRAILQGAVAAGAGPQFTLAAPASSALSTGEWHHVALVFEGNSADATNDTHIFVDHQLVVSGNMPDTINFGGAEPAFNFLTHGTLNPRQVRLDESRYVDSALALDASEFLVATSVPEPAALGWAALALGVALCLVIRKKDPSTREG